MHIDRNPEALCHPFDPRFAVQIGELRRAVHDIAQLFDRKIFGLQGAFETQGILGAAHIQFEHGKIDMCVGQHGFGPLHQCRRHVDDHIIELIARHIQDPCHIFRGDQIKWQHVGRGGQNLELLFVGQQSLAKAFLVHRIGLDQHIIDHFATGQVQIGRHGPELQVKIKQAHFGRVLFVRGRQFPCQIHRKAGGTGAAGQSVHHDHSTILLGAGFQLGACLCGCHYWFG